MVGFKYIYTTYNPTINQDTGESTGITIHNYKQTRNLGWERYGLKLCQFDPCTYQVRLEMPESGNEHLTSGIPIVHQVLNPSF